MSEEQLKAAETEATAQVEGMEEISEEDLAGVDGGGSFGGAPTPAPTDPSIYCPTSTIA